MMTNFKSFGLGSTVLIALITFDVRSSEYTKRPLTSTLEPQHISLSRSISLHKKTWNGFYTGLIFGYDTGYTKLFLNSESSSSSSLSSDIALKGIAGELVLGIGKTFNKYYLGIEALTELYNSKGKISYKAIDEFSNASNSLILKVNKNTTFGLVMRGGYKVEEKVLLFTKVGLVSSKFNSKATNKNTLDLNENFSHQSHKRLLGTLIGLGTEIQFTENIVGRFEVAHTHYNKITFNIPHNNKVYLKPYSNEVKAGIIWLLK